MSVKARMTGKINKNGRMNQQGYVPHQEFRLEFSDCPDKGFHKIPRRGDKYARVFTTGGGNPKQVGSAFRIRDCHGAI